MTAIAVFVIAFGVGCLTGIAVKFFSRNRRAGGSTNTQPFRKLTGE
jgi:F0F1-type ATP synthase membrane subunit c/vacuolar-type H+-ATPase subunit K